MISARCAWFRLGLGAGLLLLGASACGLMQTSGLQIDAAHRDKLSTRYEGREYVLASSVYVGSFFGDSTKYFIDARPADAMKLQHGGGEAVPVPPFEGDIIYAGTPVEVVEIIYPQNNPDSGNVRLPTAHTWVVLQRTDTNDRPMVMILPRDIPTSKAFKKRMSERLASMQWVSSYLSQRQSDILDAIYRKEVVKGMSRSDMYAALGRPKNDDKLNQSGSLEYVAEYGDIRVAIEGNIVTGVMSQRERAAKAREKAAKDAAEARKKAEAERKIAEAEEARREAEAEAEERKREAEVKARIAEEQAAAARAQRAATAKEKKAIKKAQAARKELLNELDRLDADEKKVRSKHASRIERADAGVAKAENERVTALARADADVAEARKKVDRLTKKKGGKGIKLEAKMKSVSSADAQKLALSHAAGALIVGVNKGGAAHAAGIQVTDVILAFDGQDVGSPRDLATLMVNASADRKIYVEVWRDGKRKVLPMGSGGGDPRKSEAARRELAQAEKLRTAALADQDRKIASEQKKADAARAALDKDLQKVAAKREDTQKRLNRVNETLGIEARSESRAVATSTTGGSPKASKNGHHHQKALKIDMRPLTSSAKKALGVKGGVVVASVLAAGPGERAGLRKDDILLSFDGRSILDGRHLGDVISKTPRNRKVYIEVMRAGAKEVLVLVPKGMAKTTPKKAAPRKAEPAERAEAKPAPKPEPKVQKKKKKREEKKDDAKDEEKVEDPLADKNAKRKNNRHLMPSRSPR